MISKDLLDRLETFRAIGYLAVLSSVFALPFLIIFKFRPDLFVQLDGFKLILLVLCVGVPPLFISTLSFMVSDVLESIEKIDLGKATPAWLVGGAVICHVLHPLSLVLGSASLTDYVFRLAIFCASSLALFSLLGVATRFFRRNRLKRSGLALVPIEDVSAESGGAQ